MTRGARDYGGARRNPSRRIWATALLVGAAIGVTITGGALGFDGFMRQAQAVAQSRELTAAFDIHGRPCPTLTPAAYATQGIQPRMAFEFGKVRFARRFGHADCAVVGYRDDGGGGGHPVCQFTGPALLAITVDRVESYFAPGIGTPATVSVEGGRARCVLATRLGREFGAVKGNAPAGGEAP